MTLASGKASANDNDGNGGAIYDAAAKLTLNNDDFVQNAASSSGGAVYTQAPAGPLTVNNCSFAYNTAGDSGGAISASASTQNVVQQSSFTTNVAGGNGGAINADAGPAAQLSLYRCTFQDNRLNANGEGEGGAVYTTDQFQDYRSTYTNNAAQYNGGAIAWETPFGGSTAAKDVMNVSYDSFASNQAVSGGGMYIQALATQGTVTQTILGCLFNDNVAQLDGGGLKALENTSQTGSTALNIYNSTFYQNNALDTNNDRGNGGGISLYVNATGTGTSTTQLSSLTVYQNNAGFDGGGLYVDPTSTFAVAKSVPYLWNSIVADNQYSTSDYASGPDISGSIFSRDHNLVGIADGATVTNGWRPSDIVGSLGSPQDAGLDPNGLQNNGGVTLTIKPVTGSAAFDHGAPNLSTTSDGTELDQRSYERPADKTTIGAYEAGAAAAQLGQSTTTVTSSANPALPGQIVTLTANVTGDNGTPTGTVTFMDGMTTLGTATLDVYSNAAFTTASLSAGSHTITANYGGDSNYSDSSGTLTQLISNQTSSYLTLSSSANPAQPGQAVTFTVNASGTDGTPTGTVTFQDDTTVLGTATLDANGNATFTTSSLTAGSHNITANYDGDSNYDGNTASLTQAIGQQTSTVFLSSSSTSALPGQSVSFTANVGGAIGTPTGTVTFMDGAATLGTATLDAYGNAVFTTSTLSLGSHTISANYSGDSNYSSSSASLTQVIGQQASSVFLSSSCNPALPGQIVTFTAQVSGSGATPTGTVTFIDGSAALATVALDAYGNATFTSATLTAGSHTISAD